MVDNECWDEQNNGVQLSAAVRAVQGAEPQMGANISSQLAPVLVGKGFFLPRNSRVSTCPLSFAPTHLPSRHQQCLPRNEERMPSDQSHSRPPLVFLEEDQPNIAEEEGELIAASFPHPCPPSSLAQVKNPVILMAARTCLLSYLITLTPADQQRQRRHLRRRQKCLLPKRENDLIQWYVCLPVFKSSSSQLKMAMAVPK